MGGSIYSNDFGISVERFACGTGIINELQQAIEAEDIQQALRTAHSIKGNSANTGCITMCETARKMEVRGQAGELDGIENLLSELQSHFDLCRTEIEKILKTGLKESKCTGQAGC